MIEITHYKDIVAFISELPGSYPDIMAKKIVQARGKPVPLGIIGPIGPKDPVDKKAEAIVMAKEVAYIFDKWNVSKPDRRKLIELLINIKALQ